MGKKGSGGMLLVFFLSFCTSCTGFNLFGARRGAPCRAVTPCRTTLPPAQMSSTPNQHAEAESASLQDLQAGSQRLSASLQRLRSTACKVFVYHAAGAMQRQLSSWLQALQRFRIESSPTDEEVHSPPAKSKEAAPRDEPAAALPDQHVVARLEMALAAAGASDEAEIDEVGREIESGCVVEARLSDERTEHCASEVWTSVVATCEGAYLWVHWFRLVCSAGVDEQLTQNWYGPSSDHLAPRHWPTGTSQSVREISW